mmetsp:Transcript_4079/g.11419  ORF Transcript_4079/g.11419 Transcript_4079/m.11419 type:complete len:261 (+) Transcript_4079:355-1137(+)
MGLGWLGRPAGRTMRCPEPRPRLGGSGARAGAGGRAGPGEGRSGGGKPGMEDRCWVAAWTSARNDFCDAVRLGKSGRAAGLGDELLWGGPPCTGGGAGELPLRPGAGAARLPPNAMDTRGLRVLVCLQSHFVSTSSGACSIMNSVTPLTAGELAASLMRSPPELRIRFGPKTIARFFGVILFSSLCILTWWQNPSNWYTRGLFVSGSLSSNTGSVSILSSSDRESISTNASYNSYVSNGSGSSRSHILKREAMVCGSVAS